MIGLPRYRSRPPAIRRLCLAVDIEAYSTRAVPDQIDLQTRLVWCMSQACRAGGVSAARCDRQNSGDGQLLILPPSVDESRVLPGVVLGLLTAVRRANEAPGTAGRLRLRISFGQGAIQVGAAGFASDSVIAVCRILDSAPLRTALAAEAAADSAVAITADLYQDVFRQGYGGLPAQDFHEVVIDIPAKRFRATAWIQTPVNPPLLPRVPPFPDLAALAQRQQRLHDVGSATAVAWATFSGARSFLNHHGGAVASQHEDAGYADADPHAVDHRLEGDHMDHGDRLGHGGAFADHGSAVDASFDLGSRHNAGHHLQFGHDGGADHDFARHDPGYHSPGYHSPVLDDHDPYGHHTAGHYEDWSHHYSGLDGLGSDGA